MTTTVEVPTPNNTYGLIEPVAEHRPLWKDCALECCGTFLFVYVSLAGVNQVVQTGLNDQLHIAICFALGLTAGIVVAGKSGGHLNPAVSLTVYMTNHAFGTTRLAGYVVAQLVGAFCGALLVLAIYYDLIDRREDDFSVGSFGTFKNPENSLLESIIDQFVGTAILMFAIIRTPDFNLKPAVIGMVLGGIGLIQGINGFAINPARDMGPRLASTIMFGDLPFEKEDNWFWVPLVIPFVGAPFGYLIAKLLAQIE